MAEEFVSVSWKDHPFELATLCKVLLDNNDLVDCSISAQGKCLKAHKVILSAYSPYFQMLFNEQKEKYPLVVIFDTSFETLKAVIDFVYCGEVQVSQENLKAFLALAQALEIKGLNTYTEKDVNNALFGNSAGNSPCPREDNEDICEGHDPSAKSEVSPSDSSQQHLHHLDGYTDAQTSSSLPFEECSDSWEKGESGSVVPPLPGQPIPPGCDKLTIETEINVNSELPFCEFSGSKRDLLDNLNGDEPKSGNLPSEMEEERAPAFGQQDLIQSTSGGELSGDVETSTAHPPPQQLQEGEQENSHLLVEKLPGPVDEQPLFPVILEPESEQPKDAERARCAEDVQEAQDVLQTKSNNSNEETEQAFNEQPSNLHSSTLEPSPLLDQPVRRTEGQKRHHICSYCQKTFRDSSRLREHMHVHTGERPYTCDTCGKGFTKSMFLTAHKRIHTGERPYSCHVCDKTFAKLVNLAAHKRIHTGERPYICDVCGKSFIQLGDLTAHQRIHTGECRYTCDTCSSSYTSKRNLVMHIRRNH